MFLECTVLFLSPAGFLHRFFPLPECASLLFPLGECSDSLQAPDHLPNELFCSARSTAAPSWPTCLWPGRAWICLHFTQFPAA